MGLTTGSSASWSELGRLGAGGEGGVGGGSGARPEQADASLLACGVSVLGFVWANREVLRAILSAPIDVLASGQGAGAGGWQGGDGGSSFAIVPFKDIGANARRRISDGCDMGAGDGGQDGGGVGMDEYLGKERVLVTHLFAVRASFGVLHRAVCLSVCLYVCL